MRMKCLRIFPETMPRISRSLLSSLSLNIALGNACETVASTSIGSDFATHTPRIGVTEPGDAEDHICSEAQGQGPGRGSGISGATPQQSCGIDPAAAPRRSAGAFTRSPLSSLRQRFANPLVTLQPPLRRVAAGDV